MFEDKGFNTMFKIKCVYSWQFGLRVENCIKILDIYLMQKSFSHHRQRFCQMAFCILKFCTLVPSLAKSEHDSIQHSFKPSFIHRWLPSRFTRKFPFLTVTQWSKVKMLQEKNPWACTWPPVKISASIFGQINILQDQSPKCKIKQRLPIYLLSNISALSEERRTTCPAFRNKQKWFLEICL